MSITSFIGGMKDREESDLRKRQEMASAFATFKQANPHASFQDYQSFIDQMSGGRNYLRGGAPSQEVLKGLASQNAKTQAHDSLMRQSTAMRERSQLLGTIDAQIDVALEGLDPNDPDYAGAYNRFVKQFGPEMAPLLEEMGIEKAFSPQRHQRLITKRVQDNLPQAITFIDAMEGDGDPAQLATMMGIPLGFAKPLFERAKQEKSRKEAAWRTSNMAEILRLAKDDIASGDTSLASVRTIAEANGIKLDEDFIKTTTEKASRQRNQENLEWLTTNRRAIYDEIDEAMKLGATDINPILDRIAETSGRQISPEFRKQLTEGYNTRIQERETKKAQEQSDRASGWRLKVRESIAANPKITKLIEEGRIDEARQIMDSMLGDVPEDVRDNAFDELFDQFTETTIATSQVDQDRAREEARMQFNQSTPEIRINVANKSREAAGTHFGDGTRFTPNTGPAGGNAAMAAQQLAGEFFMDQTALDTLQTVFADAPKDAMVGELLVAGKAALQGSMSIKDQQDMTVETQRRALGIVDDDMTFQQWKTHWKEDVEDQVSKLDRHLRDAMSETDPARKALKLRELKKFTEGRAGFYKTALKKDAENAGQIITAGTAPWNSAEAMQEGAIAQEKFSGKMQEIDAALAVLAEQGVSAEQGAAAAAAKDRFGLKPAQEGEQTNAGLIMGNVAGAVTGSIDYATARSNLQREAPSYLTSTKTEVDNFNKIYRVLTDPKVAALIKENPEALAAMAEDPFAFYQSDFIQKLIKDTADAQTTTTSTRNGGDRPGR